MILNSLFRRSRFHQGKSYANRRHAHCKACIETLEARQLLSFAAAVNYPVDTSPQAIVTADFNGDGKLDLATANAVSNSVSVLLGNGAGGFGAPQPYTTGLHPGSMAVADFNADGKLDLVTVNRGSYNVTMLKGNGDGSFQPPVWIGSTFIDPIDVAAGDFNSDGKMDLVVSEPDWDYSNGIVNVLLGNGQGGFVNDWWTYVSGPANGLATVDLNHDGNLDVVTADVYVLLGNGDGTLQDESYFYYTGPTDPSPHAVATADLTGDGNADLIVAGDAIRVLGGLGDGDFDAPIVYSTTGPTHTAVATADFNADGNLDVLTTTSDADVWLGHGDGTLANFGAFVTGSSPAAVAVGDFNGDGRPDAAVANGGSNSASVLLNDGDWGQPPPPAPTSIFVSDATVTEGNTGTLNANFTLTLSKPAAVDVTVHYQTASITAAAGSDFDAASGTVVIPAGQTSRTFTVAVRGDRVPEPTETFAVNLSAPTNATIGDAQGIGTILDDEPRISIDSVSQAEGNRTTSTFTFTISLSCVYDQAVTVNYATADGTANAGTDYTAKSGSVMFAPGETIKTITIAVKGDKTKEANERFFVDLFGASSNSQISGARGTGTIVDDDSSRRSLVGWSAISILDFNKFTLR